MTELAEYIELALRGETMEVDWSRPPWAAAKPALNWLGMAPKVTDLCATTYLSESEAKLLCDQMILRFIDESGNLAWSSHMLDTALKSTVASVGGPPEPFVRSTWDLFYSRKLESLEYEFSRALGRALLSRRGEDAGWDLRWILGSASASQARLRYWMLAIKPSL